MAKSDPIKVASLVFVSKPSNAVYKVPPLGASKALIIAPVLGFKAVILDPTKTFVFVGLNSLAKPSL